MHVPADLLGTGGGDTARVREVWGWRSKGTTATDLSIECRLENHTKEGDDEVDGKDKDEEDMTAMIE